MNIFFRLDNDRCEKSLHMLKAKYGFRSLSELCKIISTVFCELYADKRTNTETDILEEEITEIFRQLEEDPSAFQYGLRPKKKLPKNGKNS